jgi:hypothetical protein
MDKNGNRTIFVVGSVVDDLRSVNYNQLVVACLASIQDLQRQIGEMRDERV